MSWDPSIPNLRQRPDFPLRSTSGLPQDDSAGPPEILSKCDTTLMADSEEKLKNWTHHFMGNRWGNSLYFWRLQNHCRW